VYWLTDVKKWNRYAWIPMVVGLNAIFIYLFFETVGNQWLNGTVDIFVRGFLNFTGMGEKIISVFSALTVLFVEWYLCYWMFKRKIIIKL
jgi:predicted acyltransferase